MKTIDIVTKLEYPNYIQAYFNIKPVVFKNAIKDSRAYQLWSQDFLRELAGDRVVKLTHSKRGLYTISEDMDIQHLHVPFEQAISLINSKKGNDETYYMQEASMFEHFPEMLADIELPPLHRRSDLIDRVNFWMGSAGCVTQLHYDGPHNFLVQVKGKKELILFAPEDAAYLYPKSEKKHSHESQVELGNVDHERFPLFKHAQPYYGVLEEGDLLYLPPFWWHQVRTVATAISVNYWWYRFDVAEGMGLESLDIPSLCAMIKTFLDRGLAVDHEDEEGESLLLKAIRRGYANVVEAFLLMGANPGAISRKDGSSALQLAKVGGNDGIISLLESYGAGELASGN